MKQCVTCNQIKPLTEFHTRRHNTDGHRSTCKPCSAPRRAQWRKEAAERRSKLSVEERYARAEYMRDWRRKNIRYVMVNTARMRAKLQGLPFEITEHDLDWPDFCPVFGTKLIYGATKTDATENTPSIDRRDNAKGYVKGNVFIISWRANRIKQDATPEELMAVARYAESFA